MSIKHCLIALVCFSLGDVSTLVLAGNRPGAVTLSAGAGYYHFAGKRHMKNTTLPNISVAFNFTPQWAIEGSMGVINTKQKSPLPKLSTHGALFTLDGIYRFFPCNAFEPYISAGIGMLSLRPNGNDSEHQGNVNAGIGTQIFIEPSIAFRGEFKDIYTLSGGKNDYLLNLSMSFLIGC